MATLKPIYDKFAKGKPIAPSRVRQQYEKNGAVMHPQGHWVPTKKRSPTCPPDLATQVLTNVTHSSTSEANGIEVRQDSEMCISDHNSNVLLQDMQLSESGGSRNVSVV